LAFDPKAIVAGDFFGDGRQDLAVAGGGYRGSVVVLRNRGDGSFASPSPLPSPVPPRPSPWGDPPKAVVTGDFDHDGHLDRAVLLSDQVAVYLDQGHGVFTDPRFYATGGGATGLVAADLYGYGNGHLDLATAVADSHQEEHLVVLKGDDHGAFAAQPPSV